MCQLCYLVRNIPLPVKWGLTEQQGVGCQVGRQALNAPFSHKSPGLIAAACHVCHTCACHSALYSLQAK